MREREPYIPAGRVLGVFVRELGFQMTRALLVTVERLGMQHARIPSPRALRHHLLRRIPRRVDRALLAAELNIPLATVNFWWRKRHGRRR